MGRNAINKSRIADPVKRGRLIEQLEILFLQHGFLNFTMDEVAEKLSISKATIYNHLTNREEIIENILKNRLNKIVNALEVLHEDDITWEAAYLKGMQGVVFEVSLISHQFLKDIELEFPGHFQLIHQSLEHILLSLKKFYTKGIDKNVIIDIDATFLVELDRQFVFNLSDPQWLSKNNWTIQEALSKYVELRMKGIIANRS